MKRFLLAGAVVLGLTATLSAQQLTDGQKATIQQAIDLLHGLLTPPPPPPPEDEPPPPTEPTIITVTDAASLTAALAKGGEIVALPGTYPGNFVIGVSGTTVRALVRPGRRVTPADVQAVTLAPADPIKPALTIAASHVRVEGIFLTTGSDPTRDVVVIGSNDTTDAALQPDDVTFDGVAIVAGEKGGHRGIAAHGAHVTLIRSHISNFWELGRDSQTFWGNNGPGPYTIEDNYLEASGENILFGGDSVRIKDLVPSDITIRNNDIVKPLVWRTEKRSSVKNSIEIKNGRRVIIEGNRIDGCWPDQQSGHVIVLTARNQYGDCPWCVVDEVTVRNNVVVNTFDGGAYVINILGSDDKAASGQTKRIVIEGNLFRDAKNGILVNRGVQDALIVRRNTFPNIKWNLFQFDGRAANGKPVVVTPLTLEGNVFKTGEWGASAPGIVGGTPTLDVWATPYTVGGNVIERNTTRTVKWPGTNTWTAAGGLAAVLDLDWHYTGTPEAGW